MAGNDPGKQLAVIKEVRGGRQHSCAPSLPFSAFRAGWCAFFAHQPSAPSPLRHRDALILEFLQKPFFFSPPRGGPNFFLGGQGGGDGGGGPAFFSPIRGLIDARRCDPGRPELALTTAVAGSGSASHSPSLSSGPPSAGRNCVTISAIASAWCGLSRREH